MFDDDKLKENFIENSLIHNLAENNKIEELKNIFNRVDDINLQNKDGDTILHIATRKGYVEIVESVLKEPNLNLNIKNNENRTVLDIVKENKFNNQQIFNLLSNF